MCLFLYMRLFSICLYISPLRIYIFSVCNSSPCVPLFSVYLFLFIISTSLRNTLVSTCFARSSPLPHFYVFKRGRSRCPPYHKLTVFFPQFSFFPPYLYLLFMCMLFHCTCTLLVLYTSPYVRPSISTLFLCLPHLFLLSFKCNSWFKFFLDV